MRLEMICKPRRVLTTILFFALLWTVLKYFPGVPFLFQNRGAQDAVAALLKAVAFPLSWLGWHESRQGPWISQLKRSADTEDYHRIDYYCEAPKFNASVPKNQEILGMQVLIRHGDRGALFNMKDSSHKYCPYDESFSHSSVVDSYYNAVQLFQKPGNYHPDFHFVPEKSVCLNGQLTSKGVSQHLDLGAAVRQRLGEAAGQWISADTPVYSTLYPRTYQSALAFMYGLNPAADRHIPHKTSFAPPHDTMFCTLAGTCECVTTSRLMDEYFRLKMDFFKKDLESIALITRIREILTGHLEKPLHVWPTHVFDVMLQFACHGGHLPCYDGTCITFSELIEVIEVMERLAKKLSDEPAVRLYSVVDGYGLLRKMVENLKDVVEGRANATMRFTLFSAHDSTVVPIIHSLGLPFKIVIPYASHVAVEVYAVNGEEEKFVRVMYNGEDITLKTLFAAECDRERKRCLFRVFEEFVSGPLRKEYLAACNVAH
ncbi:2-phosphoxylose phosphatase 1-like [Paramacrobiotus metropolitanus]|uniref:2-phosphoxylose phosphatase 1-like n=1 Tax=Paramacrobiotus metropolitanus TaxID=2943436 RepID=UPI0024457C81|nr:2-phosphoxylose phosphatase 1-like [Paramacrobiotus metropolitanus]